MSNFQSWNALLWTETKMTKLKMSTVLDLWCQVCLFFFLIIEYIHARVYKHYRHTFPFGHICFFLTPEFIFEHYHYLHPIRLFPVNVKNIETNQVWQQVVQQHSNGTNICNMQSCLTFSWKWEPHQLRMHVSQFLIIRHS